MARGQRVFIAARAEWLEHELGDGEFLVRGPERGAPFAPRPAANGNAIPSRVSVAHAAARTYTAGESRQHFGRRRCLAPIEPPVRACTVARGGRAFVGARGLCTSWVTARFSCAGRREWRPTTSANAARTLVAVSRRSTSRRERARRRGSITAHGAHREHAQGDGETLARGPERGAQFAPRLQRMVPTGRLRAPRKRTRSTADFVAVSRRSNGPRERVRRRVVIVARGSRPEREQGGGEILVRGRNAARSLRRGRLRMAIASAVRTLSRACTTARLHNGAWRTPCAHAALGTRRCPSRRESRRERTRQPCSRKQRPDSSLGGADRRNAVASCKFGPSHSVADTGGRTGGPYAQPVCNSARSRPGSHRLTISPLRSPCALGRRMSGRSGSRLARGIRMPAVLLRLPV